MADAKIFLVGSTKGELLPMTETEYEKEDVLQTYVQNYPDLLAGDQINPDDPRRWLLVAREMGIPSSTSEAGRWRLDHLFLDQDGVPTFVECKRSSDTRARREVVAQMLDYAANGLEYWPMERLREAATATASRHGKTITDEVAELIDDSDAAAIEEFWKTVEHNLKEGKVRLVFVADETSKELRRLVEFLNAKMMDVEVLAVEVKQFIGVGTTALVPRLIGQTEENRARKSEGARIQKRTNEAEFLGRCTALAGEFFVGIQHRARAEEHIVYWGSTGFSIRAPKPNGEGVFTYVHGFPEDLFKVFVEPFPISEQEKLMFRAELKALGFSESGDKSMKIAFNDKTQSNALKAFELVFDKAKQASHPD